MMALDKVKRSGRKDGRTVEHIGTVMSERLDQEAGSLSVPSVLSMDYEVRKSIYRFLFSGRRLDQETAELFLNQENTATASPSYGQGCLHITRAPWKWLTVICCTAALLSGERPWSINIMF